MSICLGRVMLMDELSYPLPYPSLKIFHPNPFLTLISACLTNAFEDMKVINRGRHSMKLCMGQDFGRSGLRVV